MHSQLQQRVTSGSQASCSYAAAGAARQCRSSRSRSAARTYNAAHPVRGKHVCRAAGDDDDSSTAEQIALDPRNDTVYDKMTFASNATPDYEYSNWVERVEDWEDFWYNAEDEELDLAEDLTPAERCEASLERAQLLVSQLGDLRKRADVAQMITGQIKPDPYYEDTYKSEDEMVEERNFYAPDPNPQYDAIDLRALSEKRAYRAALDAEWKRREALLARPYSFTLRLDHDARLESCEFDWVREAWSHEQIMDLIVGSGKFVHPDKVKARVLNPLLPMDFHNEVRVHVVPETEEFIERIGHMATEEDIAYLQSAAEVRLHSKDFVDPTLVFEDTSGTQYVEAPPNPWAEMRKARDAQDLADFDALVEKVVSRQRRREAAADAEGGAYGEAEEVGGYGTDDDVMGEGFSTFVARDEDNEAGLLFYEDELDGDGLSESDFTERDEGEEETEEGDGAAEGGDH